MLPIQRGTLPLKTKRHHTPLTLCNRSIRRKMCPNSPSWRRARLWSRCSKKRHTADRRVHLNRMSNLCIKRKIKRCMKSQVQRVTKKLLRRSSSNSISRDNRRSKGIMISSTIKLSSIIKTRKQPTTIVTTSKRRGTTQSKVRIMDSMIYSMTQYISKIIIIIKLKSTKKTNTVAISMRERLKWRKRIGNNKTKVTTTRSIITRNTNNKIINIIRIASINKKALDIKNTTEITTITRTKTSNVIKNTEIIAM